MIVQQLQNKEVRPCKDYQLRVLFLDPKPIYDRIKVDHFKRLQSVPIGEVFQGNYSAQCSYCRTDKNGGHK